MEIIDGDDTFDPENLEINDEQHNIQNVMVKYIDDLLYCRR